MQYKLPSLIQTEIKKEFHVIDGAKTDAEQDEMVTKLPNTSENDGMTLYELRKYVEDQLCVKCMINGQLCYSL